AVTTDVQQPAVTTDVQQPAVTTDVQQPAATQETNEDRLGKAGEKFADAFLATSLGKELTSKAEELGKEFIATLPSMIVSSTIAAGTLAAMALRNEELPVKRLAIPLPQIAPGLKVRLTYKGSLRSPTEASITFIYEPKTDKNSGTPDAERYRAETGRIAADQERFREGMKTPDERAANQQQLNNYLRNRAAQSGNILGIRGLTPRRDEAALQRSATGSGDLSIAPPIVHDVLRSPGQPLDAATRAYMEPRFGRDFGDVRVHTDAQAAESARAVQANAYTVGNHIAFGAGRYTPQSSAGQRLMAHELAHVVQQGAEGGDFTSKRTINEPGDAAEQEAEGVSKVVAQGKAIEQVLTARSSGPIQREPSGPEELAGAAKEWLARKYSTAKEAAYKKLISSLRAFQKTTFDALRNQTNRLPASAQPALVTILDIWEEIFGVLITLLLAIVGIIVGFGEGIFDLVEGLVHLVWGIAKWVSYLILGFFDNGQKFDQYNKEIIAAARNIPDGLKTMVRDWLDRFEKAPIDRGSLMIGELTGQIIAFIASFGLAASKVGQVPNLAGKMSVVVSATGDLAVATANSSVLVHAAAAASATALTAPIVMSAAHKQPDNTPPDKSVPSNAALVTENPTEAASSATNKLKPVNQHSHTSGTSSSKPGGIKKPRVSPGARPETAGSGGITSIDRTYDKATGVSQTVIEGRLKPTLPQRAGLEALLGPTLPNADRAHLVGRILGDEAAAGTLYAPKNFNRGVQLTFEKTLAMLEKEARASGGYVWYRASNQSYPRTVLNGKALKEVKYEFQIRLDDGRISKTIRIEFNDVVVPGTPVTQNRPGFTVSAPFGGSGTP
ncbi:DUF4157 domain-containing protein, partial [Candidatus Chloroploca sp. M-50]